jgi:hypothetical protein
MIRVASSKEQGSWRDHFETKGSKPSDAAKKHFKESHPFIDRTDPPLRKSQRYS